MSEHATIDESSVTGEPIPVSYGAGDHVLSGTVNGTASFTMRAQKMAADSNYASIVRLVAPVSVMPRQTRARAVGPESESSRPAR